MSKMRTIRTTLLLLALFASLNLGFSFLQPIKVRSTMPRIVSHLSSSNVQNTVVYQPLFNFASTNENNSTEAINKFDRIDDVIMGGISSSVLRDALNEEYAIWSGLCRTDGGGFCGVRTLPFEKPLQVGAAEGFYIKARLNSDYEAHRRVWKLTTRTEDNRGELLYQAMYNMPNVKPGEWATVKIPFSTFVQVRGPKTIENGPPLNPSANGLFQIGLILSKFKLGVDTTEMTNFRDGFFELHIKEIGLFSTSGESFSNVTIPVTLSKQEQLQKRPMVAKVMSPMFQLFFNEQSQRRKSAMRILKKRGMSRIGAIKYGINLRAQKYGFARSLLQATGIIFRDFVRGVLGLMIRYLVFTPLRLIGKFKKILKSSKKNDKGQQQAQQQAGPSPVSA